MSLEKISLKILELFAGIGACSKALENIGVDIEIIDAVEIDKYAMASFNVIHGTNFEPQDITKWDKDLSEIDLITHGSPCTDISVAGLQLGADQGSGTRSSLMYESIRIINKIKPKYVLWENVKNLLSAKHKPNFDKYIKALDEMGYNSYFKVLNAKDYGIPQNRERIYTVSIRKDIDTGTFTFPEKEKLKLRLKNLLEDEVDEKYYLSDNMINFFIKNEEVQKAKGNGFRFGVSDGNIIAKAVTTRAGSRMDDNFIKCEQIGELDIKGHNCIKRVYSTQGISPTLTNMQGGNRQPKIEVVENYSPSGHDASRIVDSKGLAPTVKENYGTVTAIVEKPKIITHNIQQIVRVRKYPVNTEKLVNILRESKNKLNISNKDIAESLNIPLTQVEHYFRTDNSFAIPDENIWFELKALLGIKTTEFDESIMIFEEKENIYEKSNRVYDEDGLAPTLTQQEEKILIKNATKQGYLEAFEGDSINLAYPNSTTRRGRVGKQVSQTLQCNENMGVITPEMRIRKLTPKECWRLMWFSDEDFEKAKISLNNTFYKGKDKSNSQLYKQAGNSIVVKVLEKIFKNLLGE